MRTKTKTFGTSAINHSYLAQLLLTPDVSAVSDTNVSPSHAAPPRISRIKVLPVASLEPEQPPQPGMTPSLGSIVAKVMHLSPEKEQCCQIRGSGIHRVLPSPAIRASSITIRVYSVRAQTAMKSCVHVSSCEKVRGLFLFTQTPDSRAEFGYEQYDPFTTARDTILGFGLVPRRCAAKPLI